LWIGTANRGFSALAAEELQRLFPGAQAAHILPSEIFMIRIPRSYMSVISAITEQEPVFLRHIQPVFVKMRTGGGREDLNGLSQIMPDLLSQAAYHLRSGHGQALSRGGSAEGGLAAGMFLLHAKIAVQIRKHEMAGPDYTPDQLKQTIQAYLSQHFQCQPVVRDADWILSVYLAPDTVYLGISRPDHNLSDWSGGAMRFAREEGQVSRAKFKLLEAERKFSLDLSQFRKALDIGAAPGGWTSLLLERGLEVTAVDPAALSPSLLGHPRLTFLQSKADEVQFPPDSFDLLVCDMSWSPRQMIKIVRGLLYALQGGGTAIITLKLMHGKPFRAIRETVSAFSPALRLRKAKQLFHNRNELTLYLVKQE